MRVQESKVPRLKNLITWHFRTCLEAVGMFDRYSPLSEFEWTQDICVNKGGTTETFRPFLRRRKVFCLYSFFNSTEGAQILLK